MCAYMSVCTGVQAPMGGGQRQSIPSEAVGYPRGAGN